MLATLHAADAVDSSVQWSVLANVAGSHQPQVVAVAVAALGCVALAAGGLALRRLPLLADGAIRRNAPGPALPRVVRLTQALAVDLPVAIDDLAHLVVHLQHEFS